MRSRSRTARPSGDGYILVAVLGVMLLLTGFMAAGSLLVRSALDTARVSDADVPMAGLTQGGLELTAYQLFVVKAAPAAVDGRRIKFGGGTIAPHLADEAGKADLNASDPKLLTAVFQGAGLESRTASDLTASIVDMRGPDRNPSVVPIAVPAAPAVQAGPKKRLRGFQSVDQLASVPGLTREDLRALTPLLTVYNPDGRINVLSASPIILAAIPSLSGADVAVILARRKDIGAGKQLEAFLSTRPAVKPYVKTTFGPAFTVRIDAKSAKGRKKTINAVVAASKSPNDPYYVLDWWE